MAAGIIFTRASPLDALFQAVSVYFELKAEARMPKG